MEIKGVWVMRSPLALKQLHNVAQTALPSIRNEVWCHVLACALETLARVFLSPPDEDVRPSAGREMYSQTRSTEFNCGAQNRSTQSILKYFMTADSEE
jgi:hypothetical protein